MIAAARSAISEKFFMLFAGLRSRRRQSPNPPDASAVPDRAGQADQLAVGFRNLVVEEAGNLGLRLLPAEQRLAEHGSAGPGQRRDALAPILAADLQRDP